VKVAIDLSSDETSGGAFQATNQIHKYIKDLLDPTEIFNLPTLNRFERALDALNRLRCNIFEAMHRQGDYKRSILDKKLHSQGVDFVLFVNPLGNVAELTYTPYISTIWDFGYLDIGDLAEMRRTSYGRFARRLVNNNLHASSAVIVESKELLSRIHQNFQIDKRKIFVIRHVPCQSFLSYPIENLSSSGSKEEYLLYPANFWTHKNHHLLMQAMSTFMKVSHLPPTKLVFTGTDAGNMGHIVEKAKLFGISDYISFKGFVKQEELIKLYVGAKAVLFPSLLGPTNIPPLEAMSLGKFVAISEEGSYELEELSGYEISNGHSPMSWVKYFNPDWTPPSIDLTKNRESLAKRNHENLFTLRKLLDFVTFRARL
jgi:glycosyltransferase involved in cell wall biosynthesis